MRIVIDVSDDAVASLTEALDDEVNFTSDQSGRPIAARKFNTVEELVRQKVVEVLSRILDAHPTPAMRAKREEARAILEQVNDLRKAVLFVAVDNVDKRRL